MTNYPHPPYKCGSTNCSDCDPKQRAIPFVWGSFGLGFSVILIWGTGVPASWTSYLIAVPLSLFSLALMSMPFTNQKPPGEEKP